MRNENYTLNLYGTSIRVWKCYIPIRRFEYFEKCRLALNLDWVNFLFDLEILNKLGYSNWSELSTKKAETYFNLSIRNTIEIKLGNKKVFKSNISVILNEGVLFPIFNTSYSLESNENIGEYKLIKLIQEEIGLFAKYRFETDSFEINQLEFIVINNSDYSSSNLLKSIKYQNTLLKSKIDDSLIQSVRVIV